MRFMSPKTDFAFKRIFGAKESKEILISFLNAIIYAGKKVIQDLEIQEPYNEPKSALLKDSYLDVKALLDNNSTVIIEMQVVHVKAFEKRVIYNLAKTYANQLKYGEGYIHLKPVIALTITDFNLFENIEDYLTFWAFKEQTYSQDYVNEELKMIFIELPKFVKKLEDLETITDKWIYFIKEAPNLEIIPEKMGEIEEIKHALNIANVATLTRKELDDLHHHEVFVEDQRGALIFATEKGITLGEIKLILRQLQQRFGEIPHDLKTSIQNLSDEKLEALSLAIFDFSSLDNVSNFIKENT